MKRRNSRKPCIIAIGCGCCLLIITLIPMKVLAILAAVILIVLGLLLLFCN